MNKNIEAVIILIIAFTAFQYSVSEFFEVALKSLSPSPLPPKPIPVYIVENPEQPKTLYKDGQISSVSLGLQILAHCYYNLFYEDN